MSRPLLNYQIVDLERLFETSKNDPQVLAQLEHELRHRKSKRAGFLLDQINRHRQQRSQNNGQRRGESHRADHREASRRRTEQSTHHEPVQDVVRRWLQQPQGWRYVFEMHGPVTIEAVKIVYRKLAFQLHPDRGGDQELMKLVNHAMDLAREDLKR